MYITEFNDHILIENLDNFSLHKTFDCGQCFRFDPDPMGGISGVAMGRYFRFEQPCEGSLKIYGSTKEEFEALLVPYLGLDADYNAMNEDIFKRFGGDETIRCAIETGKGIRILRQEHFETLISFIISQNNNIPRIKKIVSALCCKAGERIGDDTYAFPTPEAIVSLGVDGLAELKTGFRAKYIYDAAHRCMTGETNLQKIESMTTSQALEELMKIKGVGLKVASCALLFGFNKTDTFPVDVWIKRVLEKYYPDGIDIESLGDYRGLAQQYLFYYERYCNA